MRVAQVFRLLPIVALCGSLLALAQTPKHVILFGVDGLSPAGIEKANVPHIRALMKSGSWTFHARAVMPTVSSPNWAAMIMGAPTELTGVTSNDWQPDKFTIRAACQSSPGIFPTIFSLEHQQHPEEKIGIFTDWPDFIRLFEPDTGANISSTKEREDETFAQALDFFRKTQPRFLFLHLDHVDNAGHQHGWETAPYLEAVEKTDRFLGMLLAALDEMHLHDSTAILLTSDHGGIGKQHGGLTMNEIEIPWILAGPGIRPDNEITELVMQYDTAATLARLLDDRPSNCWRGRAVASAFLGPEDTH